MSEQQSEEQPEKGQSEEKPEEEHPEEKQPEEEDVHLRCGSGPSSSLLRLVLLLLPPLGELWVLDGPAPVRVQHLEGLGQLLLVEVPPHHLEDLADLRLVKRARAVDVHLVPNRLAPNGVRLRGVAR